MKVLDGSISAQTSVKDSVGDSGAATVSLSEIHAYGNESTSKFRFSIDSFQTNLVLPGADRTESTGGDLARTEADIHLRNVPIQVSLAQPIVFQGYLSVKNGMSDIPLMRDVVLPISISLQPDQELIYVNVNQKTPISVNLCNQKVILNGGTNRIDGKADLGVTKGAVSLALRDFALQTDIGMRADDRNCQFVASLICGSLGATLGPVGAIAGAYLCENAVGQAEHDASGKINEAIHNAISGFKYSLGH